MRSVALVAVVVALAGCSGGSGGSSDSTVDRGPLPSVVEPEAAAQCAAGGGDVVVPDVRGERLEDAVRRVEGADLVVVGNGLPPGDPADADARVTAQEPPAGERVAVGACVGFRTAEVEPPDG